MTTDPKNRQSVKNLADLIPKDGPEFQILEQLAQSAILDPDAEIREAAIGALTIRNPALIHRGYVKDGKIILELRLPSGSCLQFYVCEVPSEYIGRAPQPVEFNLDFHDSTPYLGPESHQVH